ncbi:MAG TPA: hypothetical protein PLV39_00670 [Fimbriimonadaceae bacterium]|nr:hypothetical protein [Fimbriimonadaceae bacterium]
MLNRLTTCRLAAALLTCALLLGCGGVVSGGPTRGEGDIPIGRVRIGGEPMTVSIEQGESTQLLTTDASGVFRGAVPTPGSMRVTLLDSASTQQSSYDVVVGPNARFVINIEPEPKGSTTVVESIELELVGQPVARGATCVVKATVRGQRVGGLKPTIWVDGGIGTLDTGNRVLFVESGFGTIHAELFGVEATLPVVVP